MDKRQYMQAFEDVLLYARAHGYDFDARRPRTVPHGELYQHLQQIGRGLVIQELLYILAECRRGGLATEPYAHTLQLTHYGERVAGAVSRGELKLEELCGA